MVTLTNISSGPIVCDLKSGDTLRLNVRQSKKVPKTEITKHIENLVIKGLMTSVDVVSNPNTTVKASEHKTAKKTEVKEKEDKKNAKL